MVEPGCLCECCVGVWSGGRGFGGGGGCCKIVEK